jgi:hypothetical protein
MMAIKKIAKYRSVPLHHAVSDVIRAAKELEKIGMVVKSKNK